MSRAAWPCLETAGIGDAFLGLDLETQTGLGDRSGGRVRRSRPSGMRPELPWVSKNPETGKPLVSNHSVKEQCPS